MITAQFVRLGLRTVGSVALLSAPSHAEQLCFNVTIPSVSPYHQQSVLVPRFDSQMGRLVAITFQLNVGVTGHVAFENMESIPNEFDCVVSAQVVLLYPAALDSVLAVAAGQGIGFHDQLGGFDGQLDFSGSSGIDHYPAAFSATGDLTSSYGMSEFITSSGASPVLMELVVQGSSQASGSGSYAFFSSLAVDIDVQICYEFSPPTVTICFGDGTGAACPCNNYGVAGSGCANSAYPGGGLLAGSGSTQVSADGFSLMTAGTPSSTVLFVQGAMPIAGELGSPFGDGLRCVGGGPIRLGSVIAARGHAQYPPFGAPGISLQGGIPAAGGTRYYQALYRDAVSFCTSHSFNLTNGLRVSWSP